MQFVFNCPKRVFLMKTWHALCSLIFRITNNSDSFCVLRTQIYFFNHCICMGWVNTMFKFRSSEIGYWNHYVTSGFLSFHYIESWKQSKSTSMKLMDFSRGEKCRNYRYSYGHCNTKGILLKDFKISTHFFNTGSFPLIGPWSFVYRIL